MGGAHCGLARCASARLRRVTGDHLRRTACASPRSRIAVIPAKAGIHFDFGFENKINMDSRFRGNDDYCVWMFANAEVA